MPEVVHSSANDSEEIAKPSARANLMVGFESLGSFTASASVSASHSVALTQLSGQLVVVMGPASIALIGSYLSAPWWAIVLTAVLQVLASVAISWRSQH